MRNGADMTFKMRSAVFALTVSLALSACGRSKGGKEPAPTPREAISKAVGAIIAGDADTTAKSFTGSSDALEMVKAMATFSHALEDFHKPFAVAYGEDAWMKFQDPKHDPGAGDFQFSRMDVSVLKEVEAMKIDERDKEAFFTMPGTEPGAAPKGRVVKVDGGWLMDAESLQQPGVDPAKQAKLFQSLAGMVQKYKRAIGKPGITPDDIDSEMGRALMKELTGFSTKDPHRFDIDKL